MALAWTLLWLVRSWYFDAHLPKTGGWISAGGIYNLPALINPFLIFQEARFEVHKRNTLKNDIFSIILFEIFISVYLLGTLFEITLLAFFELSNPRNLCQRIFPATWPLTAWRSTLVWPRSRRRPSTRRRPLSWPAATPPPAKSLAGSPGSDLAAPTPRRSVQGRRFRLFGIPPKKTDIRFFFAAPGQKTPVTHYPIYI